ncbi:hypothetical protein WA026_015192 [Henosepilachna vigintioctopunctata]|uniref:Pentatricopeptide repeat-containing protein n=1 Tax=Henosepilachna vigintioctopunctata TaxID=420089 RepID=A0AAW1TNT3_9CUCU
MALQRILSPRICYSIFKPEYFCYKYFRDSAINNKAITVEIDALDNFTTVLLQKRLDHLEMRNKKSIMKRNVLQEVEFDINFNSLCEGDLNQMFSNALQECNDLTVIKLVQECIKHNICPNKDIILQILHISAQNSEVSLIQGIKNLCINNEVYFSKNFDFLLYEAHAIWTRGNVIKALDIFEKIYKNNPFLRRQIRLLLKQLICEGTKCNSEAVLLHIVKFAENIVEEYKDYHPMMSVWEVCFLSQWFSDQQIALKLLNDNRRLGDALIHRLPFILCTSLRNHNTEVIYRLLEIMLDFQMTDHYLIVITALLDYYFLQGNLRRYSEVIKWCKCNDLTLPSLYNQKYLKLLLKKPDNIIESHTCKRRKDYYTFSF